LQNHEFEKRIEREAIDEAVPDQIFTRLIQKLR